MENSVNKFFFITSILLFLSTTARATGLNLSLAYKTGLGEKIATEIVYKDKRIWVNRRRLSRKGTFTLLPYLNKMLSLSTVEKNKICELGDLYLIKNKAKIRTCIEYDSSRQVLLEVEKFRQYSLNF